MMPRNLSANRKRISAIIALLCLCMLLASCRTADSGIDAGDVTPENSMPQREEPKTEGPQTDTPKIPESQTQHTAEATNTAAPVTEPTETLTPTEGDLSWVPDHKYVRESIYEVMKSYADHTFVCLPEYNVMNYSNIRQVDFALLNLPEEDSSGQPTVQYVQVGNCMFHIQKLGRYDMTTFSSVTAYGQTLEFKEEPFGFTELSCVVDLGDKAIISQCGNTYVISEKGVSTELQEDYVYALSEYSKIFIRIFFVEDGQLRCLRVPRKFISDRNFYCPGLNFPYYSDHETARLRFSGYGELWYEWSDVTFDDTGAPVYNITKTELVDESIAVRYFLGEEAYQKYLDGTLSAEELQSAKDQFDERVAYSVKRGYVMMH